MFLLNSRLGLFTAASLEALLLPKLRSHFAEFLNNGYLDHLRILSSPTCVGLRYGRLSYSLAAFLASVNSDASILIFCPHHAPALERCTSLSFQPQRLDGLYHQPAHPILLCHCLSQTFLRRYRNINLLSIAYDHLVLGLGPDLPWADEPSPGNLRLSMAGILTLLSLLMPAFSLVCRPPLLTVWLQPTYNAPLPIDVTQSHSFGGRF